MKTLAIDVGINGAACVIETSEDGVRHRICDILDIPTYGEGPSVRVHVPKFRSWILSMKPDAALVEAASAMPSFKNAAGERRDMGVATMFRYGRAAGALEATVAGCGVPWRLVQPQAWKKRFNLKGPDKENDRKCAIDLFPDASATWFARKKDHQRADAALMAVYGAEVIMRERGAPGLFPKE